MHGASKRGAPDKGKREALMSIQAESAVQAAQEPARISVRLVTVITGTQVHKHATIVAEIGGIVRTFESTGHRNGPIDAICHAFEPLVGEFRCVSWSGKGESEGSDAVGRIDVLIEMNDDTFAGVGHHTDTMHATALAVTDALNKHRWHKWKTGKL